MRKIAINTHSNSDMTKRKIIKIVMIYFPQVLTFIYLSVINNPYHNILFNT